MIEIEPVGAVRAATAANLSHFTLVANVICFRSTRDSEIT